MPLRRSDSYPSSSRPPPPWSQGPSISTNTVLTPAVITDLFASFSHDLKFYPIIKPIHIFAPLLNSIQALYQNREKYVTEHAEAALVALDEYVEVRKTVEDEWKREVEMLKAEVRRLSAEVEQVEWLKKEVARLRKERGLQKDDGEEEEGGVVL